MRHVALWSLWLWLVLATVGAFYYAPLAEGFVGGSSRILFFHVPMAWVSFVAFLAAGVWSLLYLWRRNPAHDRASQAAVELGLLFCTLATVTGALWARVQWGAYWNWDPRQTSITVVLLFYAAYTVLRGAIEDPETAARLGSAYATLGLVVSPFFFFVLPRLAAFTLHPDAVVNTQGTIEMDRPILLVLLAGAVGYTALFFWIHGLQTRLMALEAQRPTEVR